MIKRMPVQSVGHSEVDTASKHLLNTGVCLTSNVESCRVGLLAESVINKNNATGGRNYVAETNSNRDVMRL